MFKDSKCRYFELRFMAHSQEVSRCCLYLRTTRDFLMSNAVRAGNTKIGSCPHGLPAGACPICNGMSGGGGGSVRKQDSKANEMSWNECYAIGQMMKAQKLARQQTQDMQAQQIQNALFEKIANQLAQARTALMNAIPTSVVRVFNAVKTILLTPVSQLGQMLVNTVQTIASGIAKIANAINEKLINITDKLAAMFGEMKNAIEKKISERLKDLKKKVFNLFGLATVDDDEDDSARKIEEMNRQLEMTETNRTIFDLKRFEELENEKEE